MFFYWVRGVFLSARLNLAHSSNQSSGRIKTSLLALLMNDEMQNAGNKLRAFSIGTPHADTGRCADSRSDEQWQGICSSHPHLSSLTPQIAKGCKEEDMDEGVAEKVNQMTKIGMSSTADA